MCFVVEDRTANTLIPLVQRHVAPGSIIYSDQWRPYVQLRNLGYHHDTVNHSVEFVSDDGVHINNLEGMHGHLKAELKIMRGMVAGQIPLYLDEFMFRRLFRNEDILQRFLQIVAEFYVVND